MKPVHELGDGQSPASPLADLDQRSREIFRRIVDSYLDSGEPVGSRNLSRALSISLSPASVRNVMSDLERLGLIYAPHTSAGRLPTETGLRLFVDALMEVGDVPAAERRQIDAGVAQHQDGGAETLLNEAGALLSGLTRGAGVVLASTSDVSLKHIEFLRLEPRKILVVLVGADGQVENRVMTLDEDIPPSSLVEAANYINAMLRDMTLDEARLAIEAQRETIQHELDELTGRIVQAGLGSLTDFKDGRPPTLIVRGQANLLDDVSAAEDIERIRLLLSDLENKADIIDLLSSADSAEGVRIFIGSENKLFSLSGSSLVAAPYRDQDSRIVGVLGVIGPTRLNYARVIPLVDYTAQLVGRLLR
ncbi:MAG: heat-inducible transcriptional repressor HrcA [Pseudomonadota bacterium]